MAEVVHLLSASIWVGGLLPLLLVVRRAPVRVVRRPRDGSPLGQIAVCGIVVSAAIQSWALLGGIAAALTSAYGCTVLAKFALFTVLSGFALLNRYRLGPALLRRDSADGRRALCRAIALQSGVGLLTILAATWLSSLPPPVAEPLPG